MNSSWLCMNISYWAHRAVRLGRLHTHNLHSAKVNETTKGINSLRMQCIYGRQAPRFLRCFWGWNPSSTDTQAGQHCTASYASSTDTATVPLCTKPLSVQESHQAQNVHKALQLCEVQWSRNTKKCNWVESGRGVWCVCNARTSGQIAERKSL